MEGMSITSAVFGRLADREWLWQHAVDRLIAHFDGVNTRCRWPMMAPTDERGDRCVVTFGNRLDAVVGPIGHPSTEPQRARCRDCRGTKANPLYSSHEAQPFAYDHRFLPQ